MESPIEFKDNSSIYLNLEPTWDHEEHLLGSTFLSTCQAQEDYMLSTGCPIHRIQPSLPFAQPLCSAKRIAPTIDFQSIN